MQNQQLTIPDLQRTSRMCVVCGVAANAWCGRCGVTPYCGDRCQRRDWDERHRSVCHNLARLSAEAGLAVNGASNGTGKQEDTTDFGAAALPPATPLRLPRTPVVHAKHETDAAKKAMPAVFTQKSDAAVPQRRNLNNRGDHRNDARNDGRALNNRSYNATDNRNSTRRPPVSEVGSQKPIPKPMPVQVKAELVKETPKPAAAVKPPLSVADATPAKKILPKNCVIETLSVGDKVMLSVDKDAHGCRTKEAGHVCVSLATRWEKEYELICGDFSTDVLSAAKCIPSPGELFAYLNPEDGFWYRARCLTTTLAALIDSSKVVSFGPDGDCRKLPPKYEAMPEFCCLLKAGSVQVGMTLEATILSVAAAGCKVTLSELGSVPQYGGEVARWIPDVDYNTPKAHPAPPQQLAPQVAEVSRPHVKHNTKVLLVEATTLDQVFVRPADVAAQREFDQVVHDVALYGRQATPLTEPPSKGQTVIAKFSDGNHYRALVKRTSVKLDKYMLEYIEWGNIETSSLSHLFPCPRTLDVIQRPVKTSLISLSPSNADADTALTQEAMQYVEKLKDDSVELVLTIPTGVQTAPSGSAAVLCTSTGQNVNTTLVGMCTPRWKKLAASDGDVREFETIMYSDMKFSTLPCSGCTIHVLDASTLAAGSLSGCVAGCDNASYVHTQLPDKMAAYVNSELCREPYLPKSEEVCIVIDAEKKTYFRAAMVNQEGGAGGQYCSVVLVDFGRLDKVAVSQLRKMAPEFMDAPGVAATLEVKDFPNNCSEDMINKARAYLQAKNYQLKATRCVKEDEGIYKVDFPELIAAMTQ